MHRISIIALLGLSCAAVQAQVTVKESAKSIAGASNNTLNVMIKGGDTKALAKEVQRFMKDMGCKVNENKDGTLFGDDCEVKAMGPNTFDMHGRLDPIPGEGVDVVLAIDLGGAFLSSAAHPERFAPAREMVYRFAVEKTRDVIGQDIKKVEGVIAEKEKEQARLEADRAKLQKDLEELNARIAAAETAIIGKKAEIQLQREQITSLEKKRYDVR
jgi:hypothetical protein